MSSGLITNADILAKLKVNKPPVVREKVEIVMPTQQMAVSLQTKIVDKTKSSEVDRQAFLNKLFGKSAIESVVPMPTQVLAPAPTPVLAPIQVLAPDQIMIKVKPKKKQITITDEIVNPPEVEVAGPATLGPATLGPAAAVPAAAVPATLAVPAATQQEDIIMIKKPVKRITAKPTGVVKEGPVSMLQIGDATIGSRILPKDPQIIVKANSYYMNNREVFTNFMSSLFGKYKKEILADASTASCDYDPDAPFSLMTHQKIVRDYLNLITPYRGLLLFHGLGSGKTCSSIAIAEGMKSSKQIIVMTPASLRMNFIEELKKCGDELYHKNQYWEFIDTTIEPDLLEALSNILSLSLEFIRKAGGAWLVNMKKRSNFDTLNVNQKKSLNTQLNEMISYKYKFINYNGMRKSHLAVLTNNGTINPFDNAVVIIDEAHNFVSRIVNKLGKSKNLEDTLAGTLYNKLMEAQNVKIVLLTGTPIINYPNEIAVLFNIIRGKIKTWSLKLSINSEQKVSQEFFRALFKSTLLGGNIMDFLEYKATSTTLVITRNPFGFVNKTNKEEYEGVRVGERGDIDDDTFLKLVTKILKDNGIKVVPGGVNVTSFTALPDNLDDFKALFISDSSKEVKNMNLFKRRILGLTSYFRSAQESLMPKYLKGRDFHVVNIEMSDFQFSVYEEARVEERKLEKQNAKKRGKKSKEGLDESSVSTYRIFSRAFCNFVFPRGSTQADVPDIRRPMPKEGGLASAVLAEIDEDDLDALSNEDKLSNIDGRYDADELAEEGVGKNQEKIAYDKKITEALKLLSEHKDIFLTPTALETYSPKFLNILENVDDIDHVGLHLIYSQFRTLEGIGILKLVFEANGYVQFKIKKLGETWQLNMTEEELANPKRFALYTGTETAEEKELLRNIFNGDWKYVPLAIANKLKQMALNNMYGEIIKVLMISASGAEGISLKNVRYVHITEPYWHPVRMEQVIGRARRICSHKDLPEALRTVVVFLYLMTFSKKQLESDASIELRLQDKSKIDNLTPVTSDQALYEIATIKENININILLAVKEASIDCALHSKVGSTEQLQCFTFGTVNPNKFAYYPSIAEEEMDTVVAKNTTVLKWKGVPFTYDGIAYALKKDTGEVYDLESYNLGQPVQVAKLTLMGTGPKAQYKFEKI